MATVLATSKYGYSKNDQEPHSNQYKTKAMEQVKAKAAHAVIERDWLGNLARAPNCRGQRIDDVVAKTCEFCPQILNIPLTLKTSRAASTRACPNACLTQVRT